MLKPKLFVFDVDHTITVPGGISIWEQMHNECGTWETEGKIFLQQFLAGEIDFDEFARNDAKSWANKHIKHLDQARNKVKITSGFSELMQKLHTEQITTAIISSTVGQFAEYLAKSYGINYCFANPLGVKDNILDGTIDLQVKGEDKSQILAELAKELHLSKSEIAVAGDSRFDIPMFKHAEHTFIIANEKYKNECKYFVRDFLEVLDIIGS